MKILPPLRISAKWPLLATCLCTALAAQAGVTFQLIYSSDDIAKQRYWYDPTYGPSARSLLQKTFNDIGEELDSNAVMATRVTSYTYLDGVGFLAGAGDVGGRDVGTNPTLIEFGSFAKIVNNDDTNGVTEDATVGWNFGRRFTGSDGMLAYIPYVYNHEMSHVLYAFGGDPPNYYTRFNSFFYDVKDRPWMVNLKWTPEGIDATQQDDSTDSAEDAGSYFRASNGTRYQIFRAGDVAHLGATYFNHPFNNDDRAIMRTIGYKMVSRLNVVAGNAQTFISWSPNTFASSFAIKRSTTVGGPYQTVGTTTGTTTFNDTGLTNGVTYHYVVAATEGGVEKSNSMAKSATPSPTGLAHSSFEFPALPQGATSYNPTGAGWTFTPGPNSTASSGLAATNSDFTNANPPAPDGFQCAFLQGTGTISQTVSNLQPGLTYRLRFSAAPVGSRQVGQTFDVRLDDQVIGSYVPVQRGTDDGTFPVYTDYVATFVPTATTQVLAFVGTNLKKGDNTVLLDDVRLTPVFGATPLTLTVQSTSTGANLSWQAVEGAASYTIKRSPTNGGPYTTIKTGATGTSYVDTTSTPAFYVISAVSNIGESADSNQSPPPNNQVPIEAPSSVRATVSDRKVVLNWTAPPGGVSYYYVKRTTTSGYAYEAIFNPRGTTYTDTAVENGKTYYYVISAFRNNAKAPTDESANSTEVRAVPTSTPPAPVVTPTFTLTKNGNGQNVAQLNLATSTSGRSYQLQRSYTLATGSWLNLGSAQAGNGPLVFTDTPDQQQPRAFYRIQVSP